MELPSLEELDLSLTSVSEESCAQLRQMRSLRKLDLSACPIGTEGWQQLFPSYHADDNNTQPPSALTLSSLPSSSLSSSLEEIVLRFQTSLDARWVTAIGDSAQQLKKLDIGGCGITRQKGRKAIRKLERRGVHVVL